MYAWRCILSCGAVRYLSSPKIRAFGNREKGKGLALDPVARRTLRQDPNSSFHEHRSITVTGAVVRVSWTAFHLLEDIQVYDLLRQETWHRATLSIAATRNIATLC